MCRCAEPMSLLCMHVGLRDPRELNDLIITATTFILLNISLWKLKYRCKQYIKVPDKVHVKLAWNHVYAWEHGIFLTVISFVSCKVTRWNLEYQQLSHVNTW